MISFFSLLGWEMRRLVRLRTSLVALGLLAAAGIAAVINGGLQRERLAAEHATLPAQVDAQRARIQKRFPEGEHAGYLAYYLAYPTTHPPSALTAFSLGLRDVVPSTVWIRMLGLEAQLYEAGLGNPAVQALGTFDLAFVVAALAPLVLLLLCHDLQTREREAGTHLLLTSQARSPGVVFGVRLGLRALGVALVCTALFAGGAVALDIPWDAAARGWLAGTWLYLAFWAAAAGALATLCRSVATSLAAAVSVWIAVVVLLPALLNLAVAAAWPVAEGLELTVRQRQAVHSGWDQPKDAVFQPFFAKRPEWSETPPVTGRFAWKWYYAMHEMGDEAVAAEAQAYRENLLARQQALERLAWLAPPACLQILLSHHAGSDLDAHLAFLERVRAFHEEIKDHFYPLVFAEQRMTSAEFASLPRFASSPAASRPSARGGLPLIVPTLLLLALTCAMFRRNLRLA